MQSASLRTLYRSLLKVLFGFYVASCMSAATAAGAPQVSLKTNMGEIVLEMFPEQSPKSVANFLQYVKDSHYQGTVFHRVIDGFMIQGGGFDQHMNQKPTRAPVENESKNGLKNEIYTVALARTGDPHSATAQFFINVKDNEFLDASAAKPWGYAVFGKVVKGKEVVDKIKRTPTSSHKYFQDVPVKPVIIESATIIK